MRLVTDVNIFKRISIAGKKMAAVEVPRACVPLQSGVRALRALRHRERDAEEGSMQGLLLRPIEHAGGAWPPLGSTTTNIEAAAASAGNSSSPASLLDRGI